MLVSVAITAYSLDCFLRNPAEVAAWLNLARTIGGFSIGYFQQPWGAKDGYDISFGVQAAIAAISPRYPFGRARSEEFGSLDSALNPGHPKSL